MTSPVSHRACLADRIEAAGIALLIIAPALFIWPPGVDSFLFPKRLLIAFLVVALGAWSLWRAAKGEPFRLELHPVNGLFAAFWFWNILSIAWAESRALALERCAWLTIAGAGALLAQNHWMADRGRIFRAGLWAVAAAAALAFWALAMDFLGAFAPGAVHAQARLGDWRDAVSIAGLGNTGHIADLLALAFPVALIVFFNARRRALLWAAGLALTLLAAAMIVCWSVHSNGSLILAFLLTAPALAATRPPRWWRARARRITALLAAWALCVAFFAIGHPLNPNRGPEGGGIFELAFSSQRWKDGGPTRLAIWATALELIRERPLLGAGAGNFTYVYPGADSPLLKSSERLAIYAHRWTNAAHNEILQSWAETGVVGAALLLAAVAAALLIVFRRLREESAGNRMILWVCAFALIAWSAQAQMNFPLQTPVATLWLALIVSVIPALAWRIRGGATALYVPVEFAFSGLRITGYLKNMSRPARLAIHAQWSAAGRAAAAVLLIACVALTGWIAWRGLEAQREFRRARETMALVLAAGGRGPAAWIAAEREARPAFERALRLWPNLTDARSAWSELLLRAGKYEEALAEARRVRLRLDATEVYEREAVALFRLGRAEEAAPVFFTALYRNPAYFTAQYPDYARAAIAWAESHGVSSPPRGHLKAPAADN